VERVNLTLRVAQVCGSSLLKSSTVKKLRLSSVLSTEDHGLYRGLVINKLFGSSLYSSNAGQ